MDSVTIAEIVLGFIAAMSIPSAITGLLTRRMEKRLEAREEQRQIKEENTEKLMLMIMKNSRATAVLAEATAKAVQRIPDAKCNGDMTAALKLAAEIQKQEKDFMFDQGIKHIFGDN